MKYASPSIKAAIKMWTLLESYLDISYIWIEFLELHNMAIIYDMLLAYIDSLLFLQGCSSWH